MINECNYIEFSYYDICNIADEKLRFTLINLYITQVKEMFKYFEEYVDLTKSIIELYEIAETFYIQNTSQLLFPGDLVKYSLLVKERTAKKNYICLLSGGRIFKNSKYNDCKIILNNLTTKSFHVSQNLRFEQGQINFPDNLQDFEKFYYNIIYGYELNHELGYEFHVNNGGEVRFRSFNR